MTETTIGDWFRPLGAAVSARQLYRPDHPRVIEALTALETASARLVGDKPSVALSVIEERLACDDTVVAGVGPVAGRLFEALGACGFDRISIRRGVTRDELLGLVAALAGVSRDGQPGAELRPSPHLTYSSIALDRSDVPPPIDPTSPTATSAVLDLWQGVDERRMLDRDLLDAVLGPFVNLVLQGRDGLLPLASLESHDSYTATHIGNVALLTMALGEAAGLPAPAIRPLGIAALLHDIGKLRIPSAILSSTGQLSGADLARMRQHPEVGARMLVATPDVPPLAAIVAFEHHLHARGGGYPDVPAGWRIHPASSMTHIADVYDALRTNRPYREALPHDRIVTIMTGERGSVFEPDLLDVFFEHVVPRTVESSSAG